jgi:hypothetical protein
MFDTFVRTWFRQRNHASIPPSFAAQLRHRNAVLAAIYERMRELETLLERSGYSGGVQHDYVDFVSDDVVYATFLAREVGAASPTELHFTFPVEQLERMDEQELLAAIRQRGAAVRPPARPADDAWEEEFCARPAPRITPRMVTRPRRFPRFGDAR